MSDSGSDGGGGGAETLSKMKQRHKRELAAHKKVTAKMGKKKKDEIAALDKEIADRHANELADLEAAGDAGGEIGAGQEPASGDAGVEAVTSAMGAATVEESESGGGHGHKKSKAQKRREAKLRQEREREERIAEEQANMGDSERVIEEAQLKQVLEPIGLRLRDIKADGHCLYRAVEDQLSQAAGGALSYTGPDYLQLRAKAAGYLRAHADEFLPFILDGDGGDGDPMERYERYCDEVEGSAAWGGQLELRALAASLGRRLHVYSAHLPMVVMGEEYGDGSEALKVAYQLHSFGLGEHYNSTEPNE